MRFLKKSSKKSKKTGDNSSLQAFILEPILTPSGVVDSPDTPDLGMVDVDAFDPADIDVDLEDSIEEGNLATTQEQGTQVWEPVDFVDTIEPQDGDIISDENLEPLEFISETEAAAILSSLESDPTFESGVFTVGETGKVSVDFLFDGGGYEGELAVFSLEGMEEFEPGSEAFIQEAASRALSDSELGHIVISDQTDGARFVGELGESDHNSGDYLGVKTVQMRPGDEFGFMLVPNNTVQRVFDNPDVGGAARPLFSMATANPDDGFHVGQIADVTGDGSTFVMEDLRVDTKSDGDYNDVIFQVRGATGETALIDEVIDSGKDWRGTDLGQELVDYAIENLADTDTGDSDSGDIDTGDTDTGNIDSGDIDTEDTDSGDIDSGDTNPDDTDTENTDNQETDPVEPMVSYEFPEEDQPLIGVIDTGFSDDNPDIDYSQITLGSDRVDNDSNPLLVSGEGNEHGTHVLGIISATQDNDIGIDGINDDAPLWVGRAVGSGEWADSLVEFVDTAKESSQPNAVVNLSLDLTQVNPDGSVTTRYEFTPKERAAIEYARQNGVLIVVAAGNDGNIMSVLGQASQEFDNIITVGAADGLGRAAYSSYGYGLDILAPGGTSEYPVLSTTGDGLGTMAGTSVASAQVTGAVSQVWAANPQLSYRQVIEVVKSTATDLQTPGWDVETGAGLLNLVRAVELAKTTTPEDYQPKELLIPERWSGEGTVTATERAADNQSIGLEWVKQLGTPGEDWARDVAVDSAGNVYVTGSAGGSFTGSNHRDGSWIAKYDSTGQQQWLKQFSLDNSRSIVLDQDGNIYLAGGEKNAWLAKFDTNGKQKWLERLSVPGTDIFSSIAVDNSGGLYVTGFTEGSLGSSNAGRHDAWIAKYDTNGDPVYNYGKQLWIRQLGSSSNDRAWGIATDSLGNIYITGETDGSLPGTSSLNGGAWIAKYDRDGNRKWTKQLDNTESSYDVTTDNLGNVYITGATNGDTGGTRVGVDGDIWNSSVLSGATTTEPSDAFVVKYNSNGTLEWSRKLGTGNGDRASSVAVDNSGNVYISGESMHGWQYYSEAWVAQYTNSGTLQWIRQLGTAKSNEQSLSVTVDGSESIYLAGFTQGSLEGTQVGNGDAFIAKYAVAQADDSLNKARDIGTLRGTQTLNNFVGDADSNDYYRFSLDTASEFKLSLNGLSADANVALLDNSGAVIQSSVNGSTTEESIIQTLNPGSYYLRIYSGETGENTSYIASLSATPTAPPDTVGNDFTTAKDLGVLKAIQTVSEFVGSADLDDYYRFTLNSDSAFNLSLKGISANGTIANPEVRLFRYNDDGSNTNIGKTRITAEGEVVLNTNLDVGTYFIWVGRDSQTSQPIIDSTYDLNLSVNQIGSENIANSYYIGKLNILIPQVFHNSIGDTDANDYYHFNLTENSDFKLQLDGLTDSTNVQILRAEGKQVVPVSEITDVKNAEELNLILSKGIYYVRIYPNLNTTHANYKLSLSATSRSPRDLETNIGKTIGSGKNFRVTGRVYDPDGASDLETVLIQLSPEVGETQNYYIKSFTPASDDPNWAEFSYDLGRLAPGKYGWSARAYDKSGGSSYISISLEDFEVVSSPLDHVGDSPKDALNIGTINGTHTFSDWVGNTDNNDYYQFSLSSKTHLGLVLDKLNSDADLQLLKLNSDGTTNLIHSSYNRGTKPEEIGINGLDSGTYLARVYNRGNTNYNLSLFTPSITTIDLNQTISGSLTKLDPQDTGERFGGSFYDDYRLTGVSPGQPIKLTMSSSKFMPHILLLNPSTGEWLGRSRITNRDLDTAELTFTVPTQDYIISVTSYGYKFGDYTLTATSDKTAEIPTSHWKAEYFNNRDLAGNPVHVEDFGDSPQGFWRVWGDGAPAGVPKDDFSTRITTQRYFAPGVHKISTNSDDGVRIRIGNQTVIDKWIEQGFYGNQHNAYFHSDGREYPVTVEYFERGGDAAVSLIIQAIEPSLGHSDSQLGNFKKAIVLGNSVKFQYDNGYVLQYADGSTSPKFYDKPFPSESISSPDIKQVNFGGYVMPTIGVALRNSTQLDDKNGKAEPYGKWLSFDAWTYGETAIDYSLSTPDARWFRIAGTDDWVPSAYINGNPPNSSAMPGSSGSIGNSQPPTMSSNNPTYLYSMGGGTSETFQTITSEVVRDYSIAELEDLIEKINKNITDVQTEIDEKHKLGQKLDKSWQFLYVIPLVGGLLASPFAKKPALELVKDEIRDLKYVEQQLNRKLSLVTRELQERKFTIPLPSGKSWQVTQGFNGNYSHHGIFAIDFDDIPEGETIPNPVPILAAKSGKVIKVSYDPGGYGHYVKIAHDEPYDGTGYVTLYGHFAKTPNVNLGEFVKKRDELGIMGTTGNSTGIHLHFEVFYNGNSNISVPQLQNFELDGRKLQDYKRGKYY